MKNKIVVDSGPLIGLFNKKDRFHSSALLFVKKNNSPLFTTLPVITEVVFLLDFSVQTQCDFLEWVNRGALSIVNLETDDFSRLKNIMKKYGDLPMDFADASVIVACEKLQTQSVASVDKEFSIYRYQDKKKFKNVFF